MYIVSSHSKWKDPPVDSTKPLLSLLLHAICPQEIHAPQGSADQKPWYPAVQIPRMNNKNHGIYHISTMYIPCVCIYIYIHTYIHVYIYIYI